MTPSPHRAAWREELVGIVGWPQETNDLIVEAWRELGIPAGMLSPSDARLLLGCNDVAIGRFDVRETLDGVQPGLEVLTELEGEGVRVLNTVDALLNAHDKLRTTRLLVGAGLPHPKTIHVTAPGEVTEIDPPVVVKPRFGSWGTGRLPVRDSRRPCQNALRRSARGPGSSGTALSSRSLFLRPGTTCGSSLQPVALSARRSGWHARASGVRTSRSAGPDGRRGHRGRPACSGRGPPR